MIFLQILYPETWYFSKLQCVESCRNSDWGSAYAVVNWDDKSCNCMAALDASIPIVNPLLCSSKPYEVCLYSLYSYLYLYLYLFRKLIVIFHD